MLKLFNALTRTKEEFRPTGDTVGIYTCGPSVYQYAHVGNFRTFIFEDVLVRYLKFKGYKVKRVMNLTDIEDKAIATARNERKLLREVTDYYSRVFLEDMELFNLLPADVFPRATEHVPEIVEVIKKLVENGYAYRDKGGSIYYDASSYEGWGELSHSKPRAGKNKIKRDEWGEDSNIISDFALWKSYEKGDGADFWETELGKGRPGWHIECSAMSTKYLGTFFDIHVGGVDNIFPHHEAVIAQSFGAFGKNPSKYWLHCRHLMANGRKMSKSANNFYTLRELIGMGYAPAAVKYHLLSASYMRRLNFALQGLEEATKRLESIRSTLERLQEPGGKDDTAKIAKRAMKKFEKAMDDNLDTGKALKAMEEFADELRGIAPNRDSAQKCLEEFRAMDSILGLGLFKFSVSASRASWAAAEEAAL